MTTRSKCCIQHILFRWSNIQNSWMVWIKFMKGWLYNNLNCFHFCILLKYVIFGFRVIISYHHTVLIRRYVIMKFYRTFARSSIQTLYTFSSGVLCIILTCIRSSYWRKTCYWHKQWTLKIAFVWFFSMLLDFESALWSHNVQTLLIYNLRYCMSKKSCICWLQFYNMHFDLSKCSLDTF